MPNKIKVDSTLKAKIKPTKLPPSSHEGILEAYRNMRMKNDSLIRKIDSLEKVIIELKMKLKNK